MKTQNNRKLSIKTLLSIVGVAGASVLMSFPAFAQTTPSSSDSPSSNQPMTGQRQPTDDRSMQNQTPGSQQMNTGTSNTSDRQTTTGTTVETQQLNRSTTTQQVNPNGATPTSPTGTPSTTPQNTTSPAPTTTQETPDQGVRALW